MTGGSHDVQFTHIKRKAVAVAAGLAIAGSVAASAASLGGLASDALGADTGDVSACDTDGIDVAYTNTYDVSAGEYVVDSIELSDIAFDCLARPYEFSIFKAGEDAQQLNVDPILIFQLYNRSTTGGFELAGRKTFTVNFPAEDLDGVAMYIAGQQVGL